MRSPGRPRSSAFSFPPSSCSSSKKAVQAHQSSTAPRIKHGLPVLNIWHTTFHVPTICSTIGGGIMPVHETLCRRQMSNETPQTTLKIHVQKVLSRRAPFSKYPPPPGVRGLSWPPPGANSIAFGSAPRREAGSHPTSQLVRQESVRHSVGQVGKQIETNGLVFFDGTLSLSEQATIEW